MNSLRSASTQLVLSSLVFLLAACGSGGTPTLPPSQPPQPEGGPAPDVAAVIGRTVTYAESNEVFLNPERGFRPGVQLGHGIGTTGMAGVDLAGMRGRGSTVIQAYISLQNFKGGPISSTYLGQIRDRLQGLRNAGIKASVRFWYSWDEPEPDAPRAVMMNHVQQLSPLLREFADVIMVVQAGFIGAWGEWHSSTNGLVNDADRRNLMSALLAALPPDRKVQIRYVDALRLFLPSGMTENDAFNGSLIASRLGHHNDCFLVNQSDAGT